MSTFGDAVKAIQQVLTLQIRMEQLEASNRKAAGDIQVLADSLFALDRRVARIKGFIEGATAGPRRVRLPKG